MNPFSKSMTIHEHLLSVGIGTKKWVACKEAREWASKYETAQEVWDNCERVDWLFWWTARMGQYRQVANVAKEIAESVKHIRFRYAYAAAAAATAADAAIAAAYADAAATAAATAADAAAYADAAAAYAAAYAYADTYAAADAYANANEQQNRKNLEIAKKYLVCPWYEE